MLGEKYFLWNAMPNIFLVVGLISYLYLRKTNGAVLAAIFVYLSLHGGYAIFAAATGDGINTLNALHYQKSDLGAKIVGGGFLILCGALLFLRLNIPRISVKHYVSSSLHIIIPALLFLISMVFGAMYRPEITFGNLLTVLKESVFATTMWLGMLVFALVFMKDGAYFFSRRVELIVTLATLMVLMMGAGLYEIGSGVVWAGTYYETGFSYRASATLFNPNVLGLWCGLVVIVIAFCFFKRWISMQATFWMMTILIALLVLSSSRSGLVLCLINLMSISTLMVWNRKYLKRSSTYHWPLVSFLIAFIIFGLLVKVGGLSTLGIFDTLNANLLRFLQLPEDIFWIFMLKIMIPIIKVLEPYFHSIELSFHSIGLSTLDGGGLIKSIGAAANAHAAGKVLESLNGRILLEYISDNSFMSIYAIGGALSLAIWLWMWGVSAWLGIRRIRQSPGVLSVCTLAILVFAFMSGFFLRAPQLFPIWIFISMALGACYCWWTSGPAFTNQQTAMSIQPEIS